MLALSVALTLGAAGPIDLNQHAGKVWVHSSKEYEAAEKFLSRNYPKPYGMPDTDSSILIDKHEKGFVTIHEIGNLVIPGYSKGFVSFFDKNQKFVRLDRLNLGSRAALQGQVRVSKPEVGAFVWRSDIKREFLPVARMYFGLVGDRVAILRVQDAKGRYVANHEMFTVPLGPAPQPYTSASLTVALESTDPLARLEAITWLGGDHRVMSKDYARFLPNKAFDSLKNDKQVQSAAKKLATDRIPWIAEAAKAIRW